MKKMMRSVVLTLSVLLNRLAHRIQKTCNILDWIRFRHLEHESRPSDIFIVSYPRSGTTWLQMVLYQLTSDGEMNFAHISQFVPWFERMARSNVRSVYGEDGKRRRIFKSHMRFSGSLWSVPKGPCRYIYVIRNGADVAVSYYHFYRTHFRFRGTFDEFFEKFKQGRVHYGSWFEHVSDWLAQRDNPRVLIVRYEELTSDLAGGIRRIAQFCDIQIAPADLPRILERCSFEFMKQHQRQFDLVAENMRELGAERDAFIRKGSVGEGAVVLSAEQRKVFESSGPPAHAGT